MPSGTTTSGFRKKLLERRPLIGTFLKVPTGHTTELLGAVGFDFVIADEEHSAFDRRATDQVLLAARAWNVHAVVRVPSASPAPILAALDGGADGILVPHVTSAEQASAIVSAARYRGGRRGFALATRAADHGNLKPWEHIDSSDARIAVIAQIEDAEAIEKAGEIAAVEGVDALFIGRGDLFVSLGASDINAPEVRDAVARIAAAGLAAGKAVSAFASSLEEVAWLRALGVTAFMYSSEHGLLRTAAVQLLDAFHDSATAVPASG